MLVNPGWTSDGPRAVERGAKLGAILDRRAATLSFWERPIYQSDLVLSTLQPHRATVELSFAARCFGRLDREILSTTLAPVVIGGRKHLRR